MKPREHNAAEPLANGFGGTKLTSASIDRSLWFMVSLLVTTLAWLGCCERGIRDERPDVIKDDFTVTRLDSVSFDHNIILLCSRDRRSFVVASERGTTVGLVSSPGHVKLEEGETYFLELVRWEPMEQPLIVVAMRGLQPEEFRVLRMPCQCPSDTIAVFWKHGTIWTPVYRSKNIVGLCVRASD